MHSALVDAKYTKGTSKRADALRKDPAAPQVEGKGELEGESDGKVEVEGELEDEGDGEVEIVYQDGVRRYCSNLVCTVL